MRFSPDQFRSLPLDDPRDAWQPRGAGRCAACGDEPAIHGDPWHLGPCCALDVVQEAEEERRRFYGDEPPTGADDFVPGRGEDGRESYSTDADGRTAWTGVL